MKKILVTGSNGLLGQKLVYKLKVRDDVELIATARGENRLLDQSGYTYFSMDICERADVDRVIDQVKPDHIIHTAAMTQVDDCELDHEACDRANVDAVRYIVDAAERNDCHLVHISTDFIFNGKEGPYDEEGVADPLSYYGMAKWKGEQIVQKSKLRWAILRTVLVYGIVDNMSRSNIVLWAKGALEKGNPINVVDDQFRSPTLAEDLADGCILAVEKNATGIYNVSGKDQMSIVELVRTVADYYGLDKSLINPVSSETLNQPARRPPVTGFILDKARRELGYDPHSFVEGIALMEKQMEAMKG
ncbi:MAG: sugar nucleotide-binding protein [Flavobacteriales bacterium]|nr:sugar nucleotide-binding protein [Flavobacteriales bacterium]